MKPVMQTDLNTETGNCYAACIASILECPLAIIPNVNDPDDGRLVGLESLSWPLQLGWWLNRRGVGFLIVQCGDVEYAMRGMYCIVSGLSPRAVAAGQDWHHAVVGKVIFRNGRISVKLVHDPHPAGGYIVGDPYDLTFLVPLRQPELAEASR